MLEETILKLRKNLLGKEEYPIQELFKTICSSIENNSTLIDEMLVYETGMSFDLNRTKNVFKQTNLNIYGAVSQPFINDFGRVSENMVPYGIVGLKTDRRITLLNYLEIIKVCLETRNSLIIENSVNSKTLEIIVAIINDTLKQTKDFNEIILCDDDLTKEDIDLLLYVGDKTRFNSLSFNREKIYLGVGRYELFVHEVLDQNLIDYCKSHGVKIFESSKKDESIRDICNQINKDGDNYCCAVMSSNKEKIREFIVNIKSSYVLVNMSPILVENINLFPEQLLKRKTTVIYQ